MKVLTSERDRLSDLYEEAKDELQRTRHDFVRKTPTKTSSGPSLTATHVLRRVEDVSINTSGSYTSFWCVTFSPPFLDIGKAYYFLEAAVVGYDWLLSLAFARISQAYLVYDVKCIKFCLILSFENDSIASIELLDTRSEIYPKTLLSDVP